MQALSGIRTGLLLGTYALSLNLAWAAGNNAPKGAQGNQQASAGLAEKSTSTKIPASLFVKIKHGSTGNCVVSVGKVECPLK